MHFRIGAILLSETRIIHSVFNSPSIRSVRSISTLYALPRILCASFFTTDASLSANSTSKRPSSPPFILATISAALGVFLGTRWVQSSNIARADSQPHDQNDMGDFDQHRAKQVLDRYYATLQRSPPQNLDTPKQTQLHTHTHSGVNQDMDDRLRERATSVLEKFYLHRARKVLDDYYETLAALDTGDEHQTSPLSFPPSSAPTAVEPDPFRISDTDFILPDSKISSTISAAEFFKPFPDLKQSTTHANQPVACVPYVIVGGGTAAWSAVQAIYARNPHAHVLVVSEEDVPPYIRTPLSKELWYSKAIIGDSNSAKKRLWFVDKIGTQNAIEYSYETKLHDKDNAATSENAPNRRCFLLLNKSAVRLDSKQKILEFDDGTMIHYKKLLIATGGNPRLADLVNINLISPELRDRVYTFRTADNFKKLLKVARDPNTKHITVIGGGFLGTELACSLRDVGKEYGFSITHVFPEPGPLFKVLPRYLSEFCARGMRQAGLDLRPSTVVTGATPSQEQGRGMSLKISSFEDDKLETDQVIVAVGIEPRTELAQQNKLEIDKKNGGIMANSQMMAEDNIYVAGDVASFWDRNLGRRRVEHWDHAVITGRIAGNNMAGGSTRYEYQSMFWGELSAIDASFEAVGIVDSSLQTIGYWNVKDPKVSKLSLSSHTYECGVIWYLKKNVVVGALLWNMKGKGLKKAREIIGAQTSVKSPEDLKSVIPLPSENIFIATSESFVS